MKWLAVLTVLAVLILLPAVGLAESASGTFGNLTRELDDAGTLVISGEGEMGYGDWSGYSDSIKKVEISDGVTSIGEYAFNYCTNLTSVTIPDSVTSIGYNTFRNCSSLTSVAIPSSVTSIGKYAFAYCSSLTDVTIPDSVTSIGEYAFNGCPLTAIHVDTLEQWLSYDHKDTHLYLSNNDGKVGSLYVGGELLTDAVIPEGVTSIGNYAFRNCSSLTSVAIPESVTSIGNYAFYYCSSLTDVTIPDSVTSIGDSAFYGCSLTNISVDTLEQWLRYDYAYSELNLSDNDGKGSSLYVGGELLTDAVIPEGVTSIGQYAFAYCSSLTSVTIPEGVTSIEPYTFYNCSSLTSVTIPEGVTSIEPYTFYNCSSLTSVTIPEGVTGIGENAFYYCSSLTSVTIPSSVTSIGLQAFCACSSLTSVTISEGVTSIGQSAFNSCRNLESVTIPSSVTDIVNWAFNVCYNLRNVYYGGDRVDRSAMTIGFDNDYLLDATWHYRPYGSCGENLAYSIDNTGLLRITGSGAMDAYTQDFHPWEESRITAVHVGEDVTKLTDYAFYGSANLTKIYIKGFTGEFGVNLVSASPTVYCDQWSDADYWAQDNSFPIVYVDTVPFSDYGSVFAYVDHGDESMDKSITLYRGEGCQLYASFFPQVGDLYASWSSSDESIATVDINGLVTTHAAGDVTITADVEGVESSVSIHVNGFGDVGSLAIEGAPKYLQLGQSAQMQPVPTPADNSLIYTWKSSDETVLTVDDSGVVTAKKNGTATITVEAEGIQVSVDVYACTPITALTLPAEAWGIAASASPIRWAYEPADANPVLGWTSEMPAHATAKITVTDDGVVTCSIPGDVVITLTDDVTGLSAEAIMHVMTPVKKIEVPESLTADACIGQIQLEATVTTARNDVLVNKLVEFSIDDADVAEIDADGLITVKAAGTAVITVTAKSGVTASTTLTVNPAHTGRTTTGATDPDCVTQGNSAYDTCDTCGRFFVQEGNALVEVEENSWVIPATGHVSKTKVDAVPKTCTMDGSEAYWICDACGWYLNAADEQIEKDSWIIPASHGKMNLTEAVDPSCTESGNSAYYSCPDCGLYFNAEGEEIEENSWVIPRLGYHQMIDNTCIICNTHFDFASMDVLKLPMGLTRIEDEAFCGISAQVIVLPEGCLSIGHNAFADCEALRYVVLPASQLEIARDAFGAGAPELIVLCTEEAE